MLGWRARGGHQTHGILDQTRVNIHLAADALQGGELLCRGHSGNGDCGPGDALHNDEFFFVRRVVHQHFHHEAVNLCFWQGVSTLGFNRVLRRHHQKRLRHFVGDAGDGDLALLHHLQQGALHFGGRAVDLVCQQQVGKHGAERGRKIARFLVVNTCSHQISRHQIGRELDAFEIASNRVGQGFHRQGFRQTRHTLHQQMALRQNGDHDAF